MNTFGYNLRLTTFGESHGQAMGGILDGMPPRIKIDTAKIQDELNRRKPGNGGLTSARNESDRIQVLSGISPEGYTYGTPIGFIIPNRDARPQDYSENSDIFRPNHADYTYYKKYGIKPLTGGGRASARETVNWVAAGAIVKQWLEPTGISVESHIVKLPDVNKLRNGDSIGGVVECTINGLTDFLGEPVFFKLHSRLAAAMMSINAAKAFEYGDGFQASECVGSESADIPYLDNHGNVKFHSNHSGGIQGGIANGMPVNFKVYFKPTPSIGIELPTLDIEGNPVAIKTTGRHDSCVAIRAVPIVEAMAWLTIGDLKKFL